MEDGSAHPPLEALLPESSEPKVLKFVTKICDLVICFILAISELVTVAITVKLLSTLFNFIANLIDGINAIFSFSVVPL